MYYLITNPASSSGKDHTGIVRKLEQALKRRNIDYQIRLTHKTGDPGKIASEITANIEAGNEQTVIIVIGGDGTINGVLNGMAHFDRVRFGFIPAGSANDLAKGLEIPDLNRDREQAETIRKIVQGKVLRTLDLGQIRYGADSRLFAVSAGIGFDAGVCHASDASAERKLFNALKLGHLTYGTIAVRELITTPMARCGIRLADGSSMKIGKLFFATFMNTPYEGGGYKFAPDAQWDDGLINVSVVADMSRLSVLVHFPAAHEGTYYRVRGVYHAKSSEMRVKTDQPLWVHTDGEVIGKMSQFSISCLPHQLQLIV